MPEQFPLTPAQEECAKQMSGFLSNRDVEHISVLHGLRGQGKSTIARRASDIAQWKYQELPAYMVKHQELEREQLLAIEEGFDQKDVQEALALARGKVNGIILLARPFRSNADKIVNQVPEVLSQTAPPLTDAEVESFARTLRSDLTNVEISVLKKYGLGIPLLIQQIVSSVERVTEDEATVICAQYLLQLDVNTTNYPRKHVYEVLNDDVRLKTGRDIPEKMKASELFVADRSPLRELNLGRIPHGFPRCPETLPRYQRWLETAQEDRDTNFSLFIPRLTRKEYEDLEQEYALDENHCFYFKGRVKTLAYALRKTNILLHRRGSKPLLTRGEKIPMAAFDLHQYLASNGVGSCPDGIDRYHHYDHPFNVVIDDAENFPFFVYSVDHGISHQLGIGLAIESDLQHRKLAYQVGLGGRTYDSYDPVKNTYSPFVREPLLKDQ